MSGASQVAKKLVADSMAQAAADPHLDQDSMGRAIITAVIEHYLQYRKLGDVKQELQFTIDNLDEDEFVITRGC
jgi:hypothetical protein